MKNQFSQAGKRPYLRSNTSVHAKKAVEILSTSTISVYWIPKDDFMLGPLTKFPVICSKQTDCSYQDAWNSTSSWKVLEDLWGGSRHRETNAAEVTRVQVMKIFAISHGLWLSVHKEKRTGGAPCPELQAQLHAQATRGKPVQERNSRTSTLVSETAVWATVKTSKIWLPICLSYQCSTFLPHPCATLPGASAKTLVWFHVPTATLWNAKDSGPCLSIAGQTS